MSDIDAYKDIIDLPYRKSDKFPSMSNLQRAAQFSPFSALKGYEEEIDKALRETMQESELDESRIQTINNTLTLLKAKIEEEPAVRLCYYKANKKKSGDTYLIAEGIVKKIDEYEKKLILYDGTVVFFMNIIEIEIIDATSNL